MFPSKRAVGSAKQNAEYSPSCVYLLNAYRRRISHLEDSTGIHLYSGNDASALLPEYWGSFG